MTKISKLLDQFMVEAISVSYLPGPGFSSTFQKEVVKRAYLGKGLVPLLLNSEMR